MEEYTSLSSFSDRQLMELILSNQIVIYREIRRLQEKIEKGKDSGRGQYWISFKNLLSVKKESIKQINEYLKNKETWDESYDPEIQGMG